VLQAEHPVTTGEADEQHDRHDDRRNKKQQDQPFGHGGRAYSLSACLHSHRLLSVFWPDVPDS
jgi:hypothetical protein